MLVHTSEAKLEEVNARRCKEVVIKILNLCDGLSLALNGAGASLRYLRER